MMFSRPVRAFALVLLASLAGACRSSGRSASLVVLGGSDAPQEDLVESVDRAEQESKESRDDFATAFNLYQRLTSPQAVALEDMSEDYEDAIEDCADRAEDLEDRIESIREEADDLFEGWKEDLGRFTNEPLREKSEAQMQETEQGTQRVIAALERVQGRMDPVLLKLQDYALFFHHNLNARAIATLQDTYKEFDAEFKALESELAKAEGELRAFLSEHTEPRPSSPAK